jgi:hypothetical protein
LADNGTGGATGGTADLLAQRLGLLFQEGGQGAFGQSGGGGVGELLPGLEIGVWSRALVTEGASGNDLAPAGGEVTDFLEEFGRKFTARHGPYYLVLAAMVEERFLSPLYDTRLGLAKLLLASKSCRSIVDLFGTAPARYNRQACP